MLNLRDGRRSKGFKISCTQKEHMNCNLSEDVQRDVTPMKSEAKEITQRDSPQIPSNNLAL